MKNDSMMNTMCKDCIKLGKDCNGTENTVWNGCVWRETEPEIWIINVYDMYPYTFCKGKDVAAKIKEAQEHNANEVKKLEALLQQYPDHLIFMSMLKTAKKARYEAMTWDEYVARQRAHLLAGEPQEVTEEQFMEQLDVLPPLHWCTINGIEMFCMSEMWSGSYTTQYAYDRSTGKYYSKTVDSEDRSTWINTYLREQR